MAFHGGVDVEAEEGRARAVGTRAARFRVLANRSRAAATTPLTRRRRRRPGDDEPMLARTSASILSSRAARASPARAPSRGPASAIAAHTDWSFSSSRPPRTPGLIGPSGGSIEASAATNAPSRSAAGARSAFSSATGSSGSARAEPGSHANGYLPPAPPTRWARRPPAGGAAQVAEANARRSPLARPLTRSSACARAPRRRDGRAGGRCLPRGAR